MGNQCKPTLCFNQSESLYLLISQNLLGDQHLKKYSNNYQSMLQQIITSWNLLKSNEIYVCLDQKTPVILSQTQKANQKSILEKQQAIIFTKNQYLYIGSIKNNKPEGKGMLFSFVQTSYQHVKFRKYQGNFVNGLGEDLQATFIIYNQMPCYTKKHNQSIVFKNATFSKGIINKCELHLKNEVYQIQIKNFIIKDGIQNINAKIVFPDKKTQYIGDLLKTNQSCYQLQGKGQLIYPNKNYYIGDFKNNKFQGSGQFFFANGKKYHGSYKNGLRHGNGKFYANAKTHPNNYLQANWQNGSPLGQAISYPQKIKLKFQKEKIDISYN